MLRSLLLLLAILPLGLTAQTVDIDLFKNKEPRAIGPAGMSGRVTAIDALVENPDVIYVGTASGGLWKSESGGIRWKPVFDEQSVQAIGAVTIDPTNASVVWAGTGEGNPRNSANAGAGLYKSLDAGRTWSLVGLEKTKTIHRIRVAPNNSNTVYVAALGSPWGPNPERGVYKTTDGGKTWEKNLFVNDSTGCAELVMDPSNPNKLFASMWQHSRKPWTFYSGGAASGLYVTYNGGESWEDISGKNGLPDKPYGRIGLAIAHNKPNIVYALIESKKTALYKSMDGGVNWKKVSDKNIGNRPFYYAEIHIDPNNENRLFNLYSILSRSEDAGRTFQTLAGWNELHPDHHAFWIHPVNSNLIYAGNDGGLGISRDGGDSWRFVENLPVAQYYHINYDMEIPYNIYGGMQDNGSWIGPAYVWQHGGVRNHHFQEVLFGDGFDVAPVPNDPRYGYAMYQGGNVHRYDRETGEARAIQPMHPDGKPLRFNWNAALALDPFNDNGLYFGSQFLHHSTDRGESWTILSSDLTTNDSTKQQQAKSGGLTIDATQAENFTTIVSIAPSPLDQNVIWAGTDDGNLQLTRDGGKTWTNLASKLRGLPTGSWIQHIRASTYGEGEAWVVANNYRRNDWTPYAYHTTDFGKTWTRIAGSGQVDGHCWAIVQDPVEEKLVFLGTDYGLYVSFDKAKTWQKWAHGYPEGVPTRDLQIHPRESDLIIATFGRSAYVLDDIRPLRALAGNPDIADKPLHFFEPPTAYQVSFQSAHGTRFIAQAEFAGDNRPYGAALTFWLKEVGKAAAPEADSTESDWKKVFVTIYDPGTGDTIRQFSTKPDTGLNTIHWGFNRDGVRNPRRKEWKEDDERPGGFTVAPGTYGVRLQYGPYMDTQQVTVQYDPRKTYNEDATAARKAMQDEYEEVRFTAYKAYERLRDLEETVDRVNRLAKIAVDSVRDSIQARGKAITKEVGRLRALFMVPEDFVGYDHVTMRLNSYLYQAQEYLSITNGVPGQNAREALDIAIAETGNVVSQVNKLLETDWVEYLEAVESADLVLYKSVDPVEWDR